ncbi:hypothetical protein METBISCDRAFT_22817 [Metschnikowia bicuspidata]|uniref:RSE1/DDB1/CPSF1 second beta-propeller domain-containing protein n=1 Tax=Metschnikowia bicuspidata TaxID=27322 RepID=A0A4P9ZEQ8_9ASCO|nr:hypothetical protein METBISCDRAFT_22817 [Metschnikowia bicuspidata]
MGFLESLVLPDRAKEPPQTYFKKTALLSPVVVKFCPDFVVCTTKPLEGLASTSVNDEADQTLHAESAPPSSSDFDEDDEFMWGLRPEDSFLETKPAEYARVNVVVRLSSIEIDFVPFALNSSVADVLHIRGDLTAEVAEHLLLISLRSGFLLLVRLWKVSRKVFGAGFPPLDASVPETPLLSMFKPFVVQWWRLNEKNAAEMTGTALSCHLTGLAVVSASALLLFRIYMPQQTDLGLSFRPHFNVPVDGAILHSCFAQPVHELANQIMFLTVTFTDQNRLVLTLYSWFVADTLTDNLHQTSLLLSSTFPFPVMVVPMARHSSFLFVCPSELIVVSAHNILSADYAFQKYAYDHAFPTGHYIVPQTDAADASDTIYLATDAGHVYSVGFAGDTLTCELRFKVHDSVAIFCVRVGPVEDGARDIFLEYATDTGGRKTVQYCGAVDGEERGADACAAGTVVASQRGWAPVVDVAVVARAGCRGLDVWALTGTGARTKLTQLLLGYVARRDTRPYAELRRNRALFSFAVGKRRFFVCSLAFDSTLVEYTAPDPTAFATPARGALAEIVSPCFVSTQPTLLCATLPGTSVVAQFVPSGVLFSNFDRARFERFGARVLLSASMDASVVAVVFKSGHALSLGVYSVTVDPSLADADALYFRRIYEAPLDADFTAVHVRVSGDVAYVLVGFFRGRVVVHNIELQLHVVRTEEVVLPPGQHVSGARAAPCSFAYLEHLDALFVGCFCGLVFRYVFGATHAPQVAQTIQLGATPVFLHPCISDRHFLFALADAPYLYNFYASAMPERVSFAEREERRMALVAELPVVDPAHIPCGFLRDDGLVVASVFAHSTSIVRQVAVDAPARRIVHYPPADVLVVLLKARADAPRLFVADRRSLRPLPFLSPETASPDGRIFRLEDDPVCVIVWTIARPDRVSRKLVVGCRSGSGGSLKILDISRQRDAVFMRQLHEIRHAAPVSCVCQAGASIFFLSGNSLFSVRYLQEQKRLGYEQKAARLPSAVTELHAERRVLLVSTLLDSVFAFDISSETDETAAADAPPTRWPVMYNDPVPRSLANVFQLDSLVVAVDKLHSCVLVMDMAARARMALFSYQLAFIPRVYYRGTLGGADPAADVLCVGVSGDWVTLTLMGAQSPFVAALGKILKLRFRLTLPQPVAELMEHLNRPFTGKVTGKGLHNVYRPIFDFPANQGKVVDFDVEEVSLWDDLASFARSKSA